MQALFHGDNVINISLLDLENSIESLRRIDRVSGPGDVTEVILLALVKIHVYVYVLVVYHVNGIPNQTCVAETGLVKGVQDGFAVCLILLLLELFGLEEVVPGVGVGILHVLCKLHLLHIRITCEVDFLDVNLLAAVHCKVHANCAADDGILDYFHIYLRILVTFFLVIALDDIYGSVLNIVREFTAGAEVEPFLEVFLLSGLYACVCPA